MSSLPERDGRVRRRVEAMRRVQLAALRLFDARGFGPVTVDEIAAAAAVGPATVYRNFGTKERVVLWDEYDPMLLDAVRVELARAPLLAAIEAALIGALDRVYEQDRARILRRARLILREPALLAAAGLDHGALRGALAALLRETGAVPAGDALAADVTAAAVVATLETAVRHWVAGRGRTPMRAVIRDAFAALAALRPG